MFDPIFDGAIHSLEWKEVIWGRYAPATHAIRSTILLSEATTAAFSCEIGINVKTVAKWRKRETVDDAKIGPKEPQSTVRSEEEEEAVMAICDALAQPVAPRLRSQLHRSAVPLRFQC